MSELQAILAERIKERRKALGITQDQLAERANLSTNFVATLEIERKVPSFQTLVSLADALGVEVWALLTPQRPEGEPDMMQYIINGVRTLDEEDADFVLSLFRAIVDEYKHHRRE